MSEAVGQRGLRILLGAAAIFAAAAGVGWTAGWAAIPGSDGTINGCYGNQSRLLRVIDADAEAACSNSETPISWSQRGPQGVQGVQGERGLTGLTGAQGPAGVSGREVRTATEGIPAGGIESVHAWCTAGKAPIGAGYIGLDPDITVRVSVPAFGVPPLMGWHMLVENGTAQARGFTVAVICADV